MKPNRCTDDYCENLSKIRQILFYFEFQSTFNKTKTMFTSKKWIAHFEHNATQHGLTIFRLRV